MRHLLVIDTVLILLSAASFAPAADSPPASPSAKPHRIVSLNLCTDELVLRLADPANIASVTWLARTSGNVPDLVGKAHINHGLAEEIVPLDPDLILAGIYTTRAAVAMLKRTDFPVR